MNTDIVALTDRIKERTGFLDAMRAEMETVVIGQRDLLDRLTMGLLCNGHLLIEGVPGLAKTLSVRVFAAVLNTQFNRIQFTPDLLPADLTGTQIYHPGDGTFVVRKGPIFTNILLADEINRAPAKVQSALLEAMQERQVTLAGETRALPEPFLVLATENPIEQEGTYPLPEAQVDRFMMKLRVGYPSRDEERRILEANAVTAPAFRVRPVVELSDLPGARALMDAIYLDDKVREYILDLILATRDPAAFRLDMPGLIRYGASPRATIWLTLAARAQAFLSRRGYVTPQDVKSVAPDILRHRVIPSYEAEAEELTSDDLIRRILNELPVP